MAEYKQLTPAKFSLNDEKPRTADTLYSIVKRQLKESATLASYFKVSPARKSAALDMLEKANIGKSDAHANLVGVAGKHDLSALLKDFGEITGALYMLRSQSSKYSAAIFPREENNPLGDYFLVEKKTGFRQPVSAKAQSGSKPSLSNLQSQLNEGLLTSLSSSKQRVCKHTLKAMDLIITQSMYNSPLAAAAYLKTNLPSSAPATTLTALNTTVSKQLKINVDTFPTAEQLEKLVLSFYVAGKNKKTPDAEQWVKNVLTKGNAGAIWEMSGSDPKPQSMIERWSSYPNMGRYKIWGIYHFPVTAALVNWLNSEESYGKELITTAAKQVLMSQVYTDVTNLTGLTQSGIIKDSSQAKYQYTVVDFSDATFDFGSPSGSTNPVGNRIGFKMTHDTVKRAKKK